MFCKYCGNRLEDGDRFCGACGHPVEEKPMQETANEDSYKKQEKAIEELNNALTKQTTNKNISDYKM